ncbi:MAG TPA: hypothetical protein VEA41_16400 [Salinarimonas sp.]|nr:hypothetical protein [Salinarimonas sp.]
MRKKKPRADGDGDRQAWARDYLEKCADAIVKIEASMTALEAWGPPGSVDLALATIGALRADMPRLERLAELPAIPGWRPTGRLENFDHAEYEEIDAPARRRWLRVSTREWAQADDAGAGRG